MGKQRLDINIGCGNTILSLFKGLVLLAIALGVILLLLAVAVLLS